MLSQLSDFLAAQDPVAPCDLIFVLAGVMDRKFYALELFRQGMAPRLILSVGRSEVRQTAAILNNGQELISLRDRTPPDDRHFWVDCGGPEMTISLAQLKRIGTFEELEGIATYLAASNPPASIALVSTSIHLRRIHFCCSRIPFFAERKVSLCAVPESKSSHKRNGYWRRWDDSRYLISEYVKLAGYHLLYGQR
jgi:hypothetical protein